MYIVVQTSPSEEIDLPKSAHDEYGKGYICIAESTVHDLHGSQIPVYMPCSRGPYHSKDDSKRLVMVKYGKSRK